MPRYLIQKILKIFAKRMIKKYHPFVIAVTGSVGKSGAKEAIKHILQKHFVVAANYGNYNNEIGVPLTILGIQDVGKNFFSWSKILWRAFRRTCGKIDYPKILIIEMGTSHPGDLDYLLSIVKPDIGVLTAVGPSHLEYFGTTEKVFEEKRRIIDVLPSQGWAILNIDDEWISSLIKKIKTRIITFSLDHTADLKATEVTPFSFEEYGKGIRLKIRYQGNVIPVSLSRLISQHQVYAVLAAFGVGLALDLKILDMVSDVHDYQGLPGRMSLIQGKKQTFIIDDTYNASPKSVLEAISFFQKLSKKSQAKKWLVLADMKELGKKSVELHQEVGSAVAGSSIDCLITYGQMAEKISAETALKIGVKDSMMIKHFADQKTLVSFLADNISSDDIILIKGSRGMHMENVVKGLMLEPEKAKSLLVHG